MKKLLTIALVLALLAGLYFTGLINKGIEVVDNTLNEARDNINERTEFELNQIDNAIHEKEKYDIDYEYYWECKFDFLHMERVYTINVMRTELFKGDSSSTYEGNYKQVIGQIYND